MKQGAVIICWIGVIVTAVFLRFDDLSSRPFHADEATGAKITALRMADDGGHFDPKHYHGPILADMGRLACWLRGESGWREMSKFTLRLVPAVVGVLVVILPWFCRRRFGQYPCLVAAGFLATSPLLVYYSRMYIHELLLVFCGIAALVSVVVKPKWGLPGVFIGLMFAAKESFAISLIAWASALAWMLVENRKRLDVRQWIADWRVWGIPLLFSGVAAGIVAVAFYTQGFRYGQGAIDAVKTFFVYKTVSGHEKPFGYYAELLLWPQHAAGIWWFGTSVALLGCIAYVSTFLLSVDDRTRWAIRFLAYSAVGHFAIYSLIGYKTPWLACLPWAHVCLLAGFSVVMMPMWRRSMQFAMVACIGVCLVTQLRQTRYATGRLASDVRNPFAYVPTRKDIEDLDVWLQKLRVVDPEHPIDQIAVVGQGYWPLPWYLREFQNESMPLVFALPESAEAVALRLSATHTSVPRGLRAGVPVQLFIKNDVWELWMQPDPP
jgi:uncharacterized protein (TIGR03663 family)